MESLPKEFQGTLPSPEDFEEQLETIEAVKEGLDEMRRGEGRPADAVTAEKPLRKKPKR